MNENIIVYRVKLNFEADTNIFYFEEEAFIETLKSKYPDRKLSIARDKTIINGDYMYLFFEISQKREVKAYRV